MCGIAGFLQSHSPPDEAILRKQLDLLMHRGPDSSGSSLRPQAAVGQTRLAVIDLRTGDPPIESENGDVCVALNGEIYNFDELRARLIDEGHLFRSRGDTEVVAHLAEDTDPVSVATQLEGMFGLAIWHGSRQRLTLIRDRFGKKPLYYWCGGDTFVFASEIKAVLAHPQVTRDLNEDAIDAYLTFGYVPTPHTFFRDIKSVPAGHVLTVSPGGAPELERYWEPPVAGVDGVQVLDISMEEAAHETRRLLERAVSRRMVADVDLGAFLSGGIDSSGIVALMAQASATPIRTFTIGFEESGFDERRYARLVAARYGTDHNEFVVRPRAVDLIERLVWHHDQPFGDSSAIPTYLLAELTSQHVKVALSGDGGDELFAGYERFIAGVATQKLLTTPPLVRSMLTKGIDLVPHSLARGRVGNAKRFVARAGMGLPDAFLAWISYASPEQVEALRPGASDWGRSDYRAVWDRSEGAPTLARLLDLNMRTYLVDDLLPKIDRMSMAHGLEVRSPFLDRELAEFAGLIPAHLKAHRLSLKRVLKHALKKDLPSAVAARGKQGFGVPLDSWFRHELSGYVGSMLRGRRSRVREHLEPAALDRLVEEHVQGRARHGHLLWTLLTLELFLRREGW